MNKTVNINLGGMFFHIDEDAYQKLSRYFEAIKRSLNNSTGQDEIIKDIEMRIAEIISEKRANDKQVVSSRDVDEVITIMGQPEDYRLEDDEQPKSSASSSATYDYVPPRRMKKLYRDTENGMIGGVATGLGHYFGIDSVWVKILFLVFVFAGFGTGIIAYFVLWIVTPAAVTTSEKLEMRGEPVNISNIEKKVREEFDSVSEKLKNADYRQVRTGAERVANNILEVLGKIFLALAKVLGAIIVVFSGAMLIAGLISIFTLGSSSWIELPWQKYAEAVNYTNVPLWAIGVLGYLLIGIPVLFLFILGLKLLVRDLKSIGNVAKYTLLALWLIAVGIAITLGVKQATEIGYDGKKVEKHEIVVSQNDTLYVKFRYNDYYAKDIDQRQNFVFIQDEKGKDVIYSNNVHLEVLKTDEMFPYLQIEKTARGKSLSDARTRSEKIKYGFTIDANHLTLDNYLLTELDDKFRDQEVKIYLYVPAGIYLKPDKSLQNFDWSDDSFFNLHWSGDYSYKVEKNKIICLDCPPEENEYDDLGNGENIEMPEEEIPEMPEMPEEVDTLGNVSTIRLDDNGVLVKTKKNANGKSKSLKMNQNGIIIKTE